MAPGAPGLGGGIFNEGRVDLFRTYVGGNQALNADPGPDGLGGGIFTSGASATTDVFDSTLVGNFAGNGGALAAPVFEDDGRVSVTRSEISNNDATTGSDSVGGAVLAGVGGDYTFINTTIDGNKASAEGGGIFALGASVFLGSSTVTGNNGDGGGIAARNPMSGPAASVTLANTILAGNTDTGGIAGPYPDCYDETDPTSGGIFHSLGYNLVGLNTGCALHSVNGDHIGNSVSGAVNPLIAPDPAFNGGLLNQALTFALQAGSPAINLGDPNANGACDPSDAGVAEDARGVPRSIGGRCDIGAYELAKCHGVLVNRVGTNQDDTGTTTELKGTAGADGYLGLAGDDLLLGGRGNDGMCGGHGQRRPLRRRRQGRAAGQRRQATPCAAARARDLLIGGKGKDHLEGGPGHDVCVGGPGHDTASGCEVKHSIP